MLEQVSDSAVEAILHELDLDVLLKIDRIFPNWRAAQLTECRRRPTLTLVIGHPDFSFELAMLSLVPEPNLVLETTDKVLRSADREVKRLLENQMKRTAVCSYGIDDQKVKTWTDLFPNVSHLAVVIRKEAPSAAIDQVARLLQLLAHTLTSLKLWCLYLDPPYVTQNCQLPADQMIRLLDAINGLAYLKSLQLRFYNHIQVENQDQRLHLSVLARLTGFSFFSKDGLHLISDSLNRYGAPNDRLLKVEYGNANLASDVQLLLSLEPGLAARVSHLWRAFVVKIDLPVLHSFCQRFRSLTSLRIDSGEEDRFRPIICALKPLQALVYLELSLRSHANPLELIEPDEAGHLPALATVKVLLFRVHAPSHDVLGPFQLGTVFPNLEKLFIEMIRDDNAPGCQACGYHDHRKIPEEDFYGCLEQVLDSARRSCSSVQNIYLSPYGKWSRPRHLEDSDSTDEETE